MPHQSKFRISFMWTVVIIALVAGIIGIYLTNRISADERAGMGIRVCSQKICLSTNKSIYSVGENIRFDLLNKSGKSIEFKNSAPFKIYQVINGGNTLVYAPAAVQVVTPFEPNDLRVWTWNQLDIKSQPVEPGKYKVVFDDLKISLDFQINPAVNLTGTQ